MFSFGVKSILKRGIASLYVWFAKNQEMCQYLDMRKDLRIRYSVIDQTLVENKTLKKTVRKIDG